MFPDGQFFRLPSGHRFFLPPDPHFFGYMTGHECHISYAIQALVRPGDVCFDVGANIGYFAVQMAAACGPDGLAVAYEPEKSNFRWLELNCDLAARTGLRIEAVNSAVSDGRTSCKLVHGSQSTLHHVESVESAEADISTMTVRAVSIDEEIRRFGINRPVRLIKIDVEGHEPEVLAGMLKSIKAELVAYALLEVCAGRHARQVAAILREESKKIKSVLCWIDGEWRNGCIADLRYRTDALVTFVGATNR
jgi:FkbM family methyltransferase